MAFNLYMSQENIIYIEFDIPYTAKCDKFPFHYIIAQNTAYSIAMKKYNSVWSMLFDLDEYIKLDTTLLKNHERFGALQFPGYWTGCNKMSFETFNPDKLKKRSSLICNQKNILQNSKNDFTNCIHWTYSHVKEIGIHFLHVLNLSIKSRKCECDTYCSINI